MSPRRALVTGGAGFIGSHVVDELLERGFEVAVLDCLLPQVHADAELDCDGWPVYLNPEARRIRGNILDDGTFEASLAGITHLVHLAASVGVGQSMANVVDYTRNNTMGTAVVLDVLSKCQHSVERFIVASSMSVYGEGEYWCPVRQKVIAPPSRGIDQLGRCSWELRSDGKLGPPLMPIATRETKALNPTSVYAINKRDQEEMCLTVGRALRIPTVALRLFNTYGPRQALSNPYTGVAAIFISRLLNNQAPQIFEDGMQRRDFVHVQDVANAFAAVLESDMPMWDVFNVGSGRAITIRRVAATLAELLNKPIEPDVLRKSRIGDIRHCYANISKMSKVYGYRPRRRLEDGMADLVQWVATARKPIDRSADCIAELTRTRMLV